MSELAVELKESAGPARAGRPGARWGSYGFEGRMADDSVAAVTPLGAGEPIELGSLGERGRNPLEVWLKDECEDVVPERSEED